MEPARLISADESILTGANSQASLCEAMLDPAFYPESPAEVAHRETHISHVFLAGELAYKI
ncbi:MAG: AAA family ATPase, partial [Candidatus Binatia bacterium]